MFSKIKVLVRSDARLVALNSLFCSVLLVLQLCRSGLSPAQFGRAFSLTGLLFLLVLLAANLYRSLYHENLIDEFVANVESDSFHLIKPFVMFRELCKAVVGVSLCLVWLAGLFFISASSTYSPSVNLAGGLLFSVICLLLMQVFLRGVERIRMP